MKANDQILTKLNKLLNENRLTELFQELDNLGIEDYRLSRLKQEFILGKMDIDYYG